MAGPKPWLCFALSTLLVTCFANGNDKAFLVAQMPGYFSSYGRIDVFKGDPSTFTPDTEVDSNTISLNFNPELQIVSLEAFPANNSIIYSDYKDQYLYLVENFNMWNTTDWQQTALHGMSKTPNEIAFDWLTGNVYWTDSVYDVVNVRSLRFKEDFSVFKTLHSKLVDPVALAVDPINRLMFFSDVVAGVGSEIRKSNLWGENSQVLVKNNHTGWIMSIALDIQNKKVYWSDIYREKIEYINYDGTNRGVFLSVPVSSYYSLSMSKSVICGADNYDYYAKCFDLETKNTTFSESYWYNQPWGSVVYDAEMQTIENHPCASKNCEQFCFNIDQNTARCECKEGYILNQDGITCKSQHGLVFGKAFIIANKTAACMYDAYSGLSGKIKPDCILTNLSNVIFMAVDSHTRQIYYVDNGGGSRSSIKQVDMVSTQETVLARDIPGQVTGLTLDWTTKDVYWIEGTDIVVHSAVTKQSSILISNLQNPRSLTINPHAEELYWAEGFGYSSTIQVCSTNGKEKKSLVTDKIYHPRSLYYYYQENRLYWLNDAYVKSVKSDGTSLQTDTEVGKDVKQIFVYKGYIYYTKGDDRVHLNRLSVDSSDANFTATELNSISFIASFDTDTQQLEHNGCMFFNGGCQHVCEPIGTTSVECLCSFGYTLQSDGKSCSSTPFQDNFAILSDYTHDKMYQASTINGEIRALDFDNVIGPVANEYDMVDNKVFWVDYWAQTIYASKLQGGPTETIYKANYVRPYGLAFDYSTGIMYYTARPFFFYGEIGVIHPHVKIQSSFRLDVERPTAIAVYPAKGMMCFTDDGSTPYVGCADMDGENFRKLATNTGYPRGIAFDYQNNHIYWVDRTRSTLERMDLDGNNKKIVTQESGALLSGIDITNDYIYYIGHNKQQISRLHLANETKSEYMNDIHFLGKIFDISVHPGQRQPIHEECATNNGGCALFCFPKPNGHSCGCPEYEILNKDNKTCTGHVACPIIIPHATLEDRCIGHPTGACDYTCETGYEKTSSQLKCDEFGNWDRDINTVCQSTQGTCVDRFTGGYVNTQECDRKLGTTCDYYCYPGYTPNPQTPQITCQHTGIWSVPVDTLCRHSSEVCSQTIDHGTVSATCPLTAASVCDYSCNPGYMKNPQIETLVCVDDGTWHVDGDICLPVYPMCSSNLPNGQFAQLCTFKAKSTCEYVCNAGYMKENNINKVYCLENGNWNYNINNLCTKQLASCDKSQLQHGTFDEQCPATSGSSCSYTCTSPYVPHSIVNHLTCLNGNWSVKTDSVCIENVVTPQVGAKTQDEDVSVGALAGIVVAALIITFVVVLGIVYFLWRRKQPQGQYVSNNTNMRFKRDGGHAPQQSPAAFTNPIAAQNDYGNFGTLRDERYVTTDISPSYDNVDLKNENNQFENLPTDIKRQSKSEA